MPCGGKGGDCCKGKSIFLLFISLFLIHFNGCYELNLLAIKLRRCYHVENNTVKRRIIF